MLDSLCVPQYNKDGEERVILFLKMASGHTFRPDLVKRIREAIRLGLSARHVPSLILETQGIPVGPPQEPPCFRSTRLDACSCFIYSCSMLPGNPVPILFSFLPSLSLSFFLTPHKLDVRQLLLNTGLQRVSRPSPARPTGFSRVVLVCSQIINAKINFNFLKSRWGAVALAF